MSAASPSDDDGATTPCPVCQSFFVPVGRQRYCSTACRRTAWTRRHRVEAPAVVVPPARPRRPLTVYECPTCETRYVGEQRCDACGVFCRRIGLGGSCPHCDEPVALSDLLDEGVMPRA